MEICHNTSSKEDIRTHLRAVSQLFVPELSSYVDIEQYAKKIYEKAERIEAWDEDRLVGLVAYYLNSDGAFAFITNVSIEIKYGGQGIAGQMMRMMQEKLQGKIETIRLEVNVENTGAIGFYKKHGFDVSRGESDTLMMVKKISQ